MTKKHCDFCQCDLTKKSPFKRSPDKNWCSKACAIKAGVLPVPPVTVKRIRRNGPSPRGAMKRVYQNGVGEVGYCGAI